MLIITRCIFFVCFLFFVISYTHAHDLGVVHIDLHEIDEGGYIIQAKLPASFQPTPFQVPVRCNVTQSGSIRIHARNQIVKYELKCEGHSLGITDKIFFPWDREGVFVSALWRDGEKTTGYFHNENNGISINISELKSEKLDVFQTMKRYVHLGIVHIILGWDHLAFVFALCLIAWGWNLVKLVTAFTIGHSFTLALAVFGYANIPIPPVEACIALSIAFVAREAIVGKGKTKHGVGIVLAFGLLHGLGFASSLAETGIKNSDLLFGLVSFNVGVEIGQLIFILLIVLAVQFFKVIHLQHLYNRFVISSLLGIIAMFWTFERVYSFLY